MSEPAARPGAPTAGPWSAGSVFGPGGLEIAGVGAEGLAARYGTPLLVVDEEDVRSRCRAMAARFPRVLYAVKAFTAHALLRIAVEEGLGLLVSSDGELEAALRAGVAAPRIALHGNNKSDHELEMATSAGVGLVIVDNAEELRRLDAVARARRVVVDVLLRMIPEVETDTHPAIATGHAASKFGTPLSGSAEVIGLANSLPNLRLAGVHAHLGSQLLSVEPYLRAVDTLLDLLEEVPRRGDALILDLGGGFGVTYTDEPALDLDRFARQVLARVEAGAGLRGLPVPEVVVEPGRALVANAVVTLYRVGATKEVGGRTLVAVDGGMSDNPRPSLYGARYEVALASAPAAGPARPVTVVGRHCESGDVVADDALLPGPLARGALLAVAGTGAYTYAMASTYNRVGRPAVVAVRDGRTSPWLRREDPGDLDRLETAAHRPAPQASPVEGVEIRPATPRDARSFLSFWREIVAEGRSVRSESVQHPLRVYRARFRHPWTDREAQVLAVAGGRVVGHLYVQREEHPVTRHVATLGIAVAASHRGRGVGSALLSEAFRWARATGVEKLLLSVYPHNTAAVALYRKFGFVDEGRLARQSRKSYGYEDEILMATWLGSDRTDR